jgi:hypothetical protein
MKRFIACLLLAGCIDTYAQPPSTDRVAQDTTAHVSEPPATVYVPLRADYRQPVTLPPATLPATPCPEWYDTALRVGWPVEEWETLARIMFRESRCLPGAINGDDPNGGSTGLTQINHYWCKPSVYHPAGWLQEQGVLATCDDLFNPETNLRAALYLFTYSKYRNGNGWNPWKL